MYGLECLGLYLMDKYIINQIPKEKSLYRNLTLELLRTLQLKFNKQLPIENILLLLIQLASRASGRAGNTTWLHRGPPYGMST
jgi:hypothetical protein